MGGKIRKTGIDILGDVPWGTHFCQFYQTKEDLIDILVPYFKAGLENNEFCMWVTSEPLSEKEAKKALREALPDIDRYLKRGQIEIGPHEKWYLKGSTFSLERVLNGWIEKHNQALAQGYDGIKITGNTAWLEKKNWRNFAEYEAKINNVIGNYKMLAICSYSLDKCGASEVIDVVSNHQFALIRREGKWEAIESSERKRTEEALRESEGRYRLLFENSGAAICFWDTEGRCVLVNKEGIKNHGEKDITGKSIYEVHPEIADIYMKRLKKIMRDGKGGTFEDSFELPKGKRWLSSNIQPVKNKDGKAIGVQIISNDITKRKQAEEALRESEERYRSFFEQAPDSIVLVDAETGELVEFNDKAHENLGYTREEFKKLRIPNFEVIESAEEVAKHIKKIIRDGSDTFETKHRTKGGKIQDILVSSRALSIEGKDYIQSIWSDITERKRAEEEIKSSREQLRNLAAHLQSVREEERKLIAREIHDELGQSLTALKMDLFWLDKRMPIDQKPLLKKTKSMSKLIDKTVRRIKKISAELRPGLLDYLGLPAAIEWEGEEFQNRTGIKCEVSLDSEDIILDQDRSTALFRIFQETLTNAARHSNATRVKVSLKEKAGKLELRVRDNGKGITEKQISDPKSFGLIGMRERAQFLGGEVEIRGVQDKGTTVRARIPLPQQGKN